MIKIDLARAIAGKLSPQITQKDADAILTAFMDVISEALEKGEKFSWLALACLIYAMSLSTKAEILKQGTS